MNTKTKTFLILFSVVALLLGWLVWHTDWDVRAIHKQLNALVELVEKEGRVSTFEALARSRKLPDFFAEDAQVEYLPGRQLPADKDALGPAFLSAWGQIESASIRLSRHEVSVDEEGSTAESTVYVTAKVVVSGEDQVGDTLEYRILWVKEDGIWRIEAVIPVVRR